MVHGIGLLLSGLCHRLVSRGFPTEFYSADNLGRLDSFLFSFLFLQSFLGLFLVLQVFRGLHGLLVGFCESSGGFRNRKFRVPGGGWRNLLFFGLFRNHRDGLGSVGMRLFG